MKVVFEKNITENPSDEAERLIYADWLEEIGDKERADWYRNSCKPIKEFNKYDWREVFKYADPARANPGSGTNTTPFALKDVRRVIASQDGDNDGPDWVMCGELWDGRFFAIRAGCDYTGWG